VIMAMVVVAGHVSGSDRGRFRVPKQNTPVPIDPPLGLWIAAL
jgi:hypothetical protein